MLRDSMELFRKLVYMADLSIVALGFQLSAFFDDNRLAVTMNLFNAENIILPSVVIWGIVLWHDRRIYEIRMRSIGDIFRALLRISVLASCSLAVFMYVTGYLGASRFRVILSSILSFFLIFLFRMAIIALLRYFRSRGFNTQNILVVGTGNQARNFADRTVGNPHLGWRIKGFIDWEANRGLWRYHDIPCVGELCDLERLLKGSQVDWVVFAVGRKYLEKIESAIEICEVMGINTAVLADFFPPKLSRRNIESFLGFPVMCYHNGPRPDTALILKDLGDRILGLLGLILFSPVMLAVAAAVKLSSGSPIIFRQERCGLNGRKFTIYKFRTMVKNAEKLKESLMRFNEIDGHAFKMENDPRITRVGRFLRKTSLDELPQLLNVVKGDMSLVGPRPPLNSEVEGYDHWQRRKLSMKPGLTGLWQVSGRSEIPFEQWMKLDLNYIDNWSLWEDTKIIAKTIPAVIRGKGAR